MRFSPEADELRSSCPPQADGLSQNDPPTLCELWRAGRPDFLRMTAGGCGSEVLRLGRVGDFQTDVIFPLAGSRYL